MKTAERERKRIYRVITGDRIFSEHKTFSAALSSRKKAKDYASKGLLALTPSTPVHTERWSAKYSTWERVS